MEIVTKNGYKFLSLSLKKTLSHISPIDMCVLGVGVGGEDTILMKEMKSQKNKY